MSQSQLEQHSHSADQLDLEKETSQMHQVGESLIRQALAKGASQVEVGVSKDLGLSVQVRNQDVETLEFNRDNSFGLTVYFGQQKGTATTSDLSPKALEETVNAACNIARFTQPDACAGLADASLMASQPVDLELDSPMGITANKAKAMALECEAAGLAASDQISQSEGASFSSHRNIRFYANSHGFAAAIPSTRHSLSCVLIAQEAQGMQRDYWYSLSRNAAALQSASEIGRQAAERTVSRLGGRSITTRKVPVLMVPEVARGMVSHLSSAIRGASIYRKSSFLLDHLGKQIFPEFVQIDERPFIKGGLASSWFDNEGVATREQPIINQGELATYMLNSYSARRMQMQPTGHAGGAHNLQVKPTAGGFDALVKQMHRGLIVTEVMGQGVNLVNGDYSRGASGFWVENGEIQHFVQEITIAGNLKQMFNQVVAIGDDQDPRSSTLTGSWLLQEMTVAGHSG